MRLRITLSFTFLLVFLTRDLYADSISTNPIIFVTMIPNPGDTKTISTTFLTHLATPDGAFRGGDLWIRYSDGTLRNLTQAAGYGTTGFQGNIGIAVRDPAVSWDGTKVLFSMVVGAPANRTPVGTYYWQLYEITHLGVNETPVITKVARQPDTFNNISPTYGSDDQIIFVSDRPRDASVMGTYPQRDEYEATPINSGLWRLNPQTGDLNIVDHAPSGDFNPIVDSYGRVIFTRWDHLQRDPQNYGAFTTPVNYLSETSSSTTGNVNELFPEPHATQDPDYRSTVNIHILNQFFPWMVNQDGTELETLNHVGRHELSSYIQRNFNDDPNVQEYFGQYTTGANQNKFKMFFQIKEDPVHPGTYFGTNCQEFGTHAAGQLLSMNGAPGVNPNNMIVNYLTPFDTSTSSDTPPNDHTGLYRDALPLTNGTLLASHVSETRMDANTGTSAAPGSRYDFRIKKLVQSGSYFAPSTLVTSGITKSVSFWASDQMVSYNGTLWEMMPVELVSRTRPNAPTIALPNVEATVIASKGVAINDLKNYLYANDLALVVSRNLTSRDKNDRQQPTNLRVTGTSTQTVPNSGKIYDVSLMQFFQGDLVRGFLDSSLQNGRRVLAQRMHSVPDAANPLPSGAAVGSTQIAADGSMAAFVPAKRALTWQMSDAAGNAVVRERYWITLQAGEIRVCTSCHGVNTVDQAGNTAPVNPPQALGQLLDYWKGSSQVVPTAVPTGIPTTIPTTRPTVMPTARPTAMPTVRVTPLPTRPVTLPSPNPEPSRKPTAVVPVATPVVYSLQLAPKPTAKAGGKFTVVAKGAKKDSLRLRAAVNGRTCAAIINFKTGTEARSLTGKFPKLPGAKVKLTLLVGTSSKVKDSETVLLPSEDLKRITKPNLTLLCRALTASIK